MAFINLFSSLKKKKKEQISCKKKCTQLLIYTNKYSNDTVRESDCKNKIILFNIKANCAFGVIFSI